ncbi:MAG: hypothetical protein ACXVB5_23085, partial [Isosphaeraceae bacterium]
RARIRSRSTAPDPSPVRDRGPRGGSPAFRGLLPGLLLGLLLGGLTAGQRPLHRPRMHADPESFGHRGDQVADSRRVECPVPSGLGTQ